jgi:hypothetical protein
MNTANNVYNSPCFWINDVESRNGWFCKSLSCMNVETPLECSTALNGECIFDSSSSLCHKKTCLEYSSLAEMDPYKCENFVSYLRKSCFYLKDESGEGGTCVDPQDVTNPPYVTMQR